MHVQVVGTLYSVHAVKHCYCYDHHNLTNQPLNLTLQKSCLVYGSIQLCQALEPGPKRYNHHSGRCVTSTTHQVYKFRVNSTTSIYAITWTIQLHMKPTNLYASGGFLEETVSPEVIQYTPHDWSGVKASTKICSSYPNKGFTYLLSTLMQGY